MTDSEPVQLTDSNELLYRQISPSWIQDGRFGSNAFNPTPKDRGMLSVSRSSKTTPQAAHETHVRQGLTSMGTMGVSVFECREAALTARDDPRPENKAHAFIDFRGLSGNQCKIKAQLLRNKAEARGFLYKSDDSAQQAG